MTQIIKKTKFWAMVRNTLAVITGPTTVGLHEFGSADHWVMIAGFSGMLGAILAIWMVDHDNDGIVDIFQ